MLGEKYKREQINRIAEDRVEVGNGVKRMNRTRLCTQRSRRKTTVQSMSNDHVCAAEAQLNDSMLRDFDNLLGIGEHTLRLVAGKYAEVPNMNTKNTGRILVVDDNETALEALANLLRREGFSVLRARSGMDALYQAKTNKSVCLMLLDLWMPVMDGWKVLQRKQQDSKIADIPVIVLSAVPPASLDGARAVLKKPVDPGSLIKAVEQCCQ